MQPSISSLHCFILHCSSGEDGEQSTRYVTCSIHTLEDTLEDASQDTIEDTVEDTIEDSFENAFLPGVKISLARQLIARSSKSQFLAEAKSMLMSRGAQDNDIDIERHSIE